MTSIGSIVAPSRAGPRQVRSCCSGVLLVAAACGSSSKTTAPTSVPVPTSSHVVDPGRHRVGPSGRPVCRVIGRPHDRRHRARFPLRHRLLPSSGPRATRARWPPRSRARPSWETYLSAPIPSKNTGLEGAANGNWVSWYALFATSPLVLGYNPKSKFAAGPQDRALVQGPHQARHPGGPHRPGHRPQGCAGGHGPARTPPRPTTLPALKATGNRTSQRLPGEHPGRPAPGRTTRRRLLLRGGGRPPPTSPPSP